MVSFEKMGSRFLLMIISFVLIATLLQLETEFPRDS